MNVRRPTTTPQIAPLPERTVVHMLRHGADAYPDRPAVRDEVEALSYQELHDEAARVGGGMHELGVGPGDPVLLMLDNSVDHVLSWFGVNWVGGLEVPINTAAMPPQLAYIANDCRASVLVVEEAYAPRVLAVADRLRHVRHVVVRGDPAAAAGPSWQVHDLAGLRRHPGVPPVAQAPSDPCGIVYTSGTTGSPKGVLVTHAQTYGRNGPLRPGSPQPGDVCLVVLPLYHVLGQCRVLYNGLIAGCSVVLQPGFSASRFWDVCRRFGVTYTCLVGVMAQYLLAQPERADDGDNPLQRITLGTTIREIDEFRRRFHLPEAYVSYGLTEAGGVLVGPARGDGCGYLRDDFEAQLVDEHDLPVPDGEIGELVLRPREPWTTMLGYLNQPKETARKWRNLWLHTGDLMHRCEDGRYVFHGRRSESIRHKGENISPTSIEAELVRHPAVAECAAVGIRDGDGADEEILVAVVPAPGMSVEPIGLIEHLAAQLPAFAVPRYVRVTDQLPRTDSTRRIQRTQLRDLGTRDAWDRVAAGVLVDRSGAVHTTQQSEGRA